jgi:hypothetical protein
MSTAQTDPREPWRQMLLRQREECEQALSYYRQLCAAVPDEQKWKLEKDSIFSNTLKGLVSPERVQPTTELEIAIQTMDEYLAALDRFTNDQFAAFLFGVGLIWSQIFYSGLERLRQYRDKLQESMEGHAELARRVPQNGQWQLRREVEGPLPLVPSDVMYPADILQRTIPLVDSMLAVLTNRSF